MRELTIVWEIPAELLVLLVEQVARERVSDVVVAEAVVLGVRGQWGVGY